MHRLIFGHSFAVLVAPILLSVLAVKFLNKKRTSVDRNAEDADASVPDPSTEINAEDADASVPDPSTETNAEDADAGAPDSSTETNLGASSSSTTPTEISNGTSRSSTMPIGGDYEVYLSFRGLDTRRGFTGHLYSGLLDAGIRVFKDDEELRHGEEIAPELLAALKNSRISILILSENYGSSTWLLNELVQIMECRKNRGNLVLPIFYEVNPADVRYQNGSFGKGFRQMATRSDPESLEQWRRTLKEVGSLSGCVVDRFDRDEADLIKKVVQRVSSVLKTQFQLAVAEDLVGVGNRADKVLEYVFNNSHAVLFIGIHGMGGIGKTTLAKVIYNTLHHHFESHSYIYDIREASKRQGIGYLQNRLIGDILKPGIQVHDKDEGIMFLSSNIRHKKVLVLLDDVDDYYQLEALAGNHNWFSSGSVILITTRNKRVLDIAGVDYSYEHKQLDDDQSLMLFSRHAFRRDSPPSEFKDLTDVVVSNIGGLPLSLKILGSLLRGKRRAVWMDTITKLREIPLQEVQGKLRISFEALDPPQKEMFLDIACCLIGTDVRMAYYMWSSCDFFPAEGIETLRLMSLIKVGHNNELQMHDQLRDLGRQIVRERSPREPQHLSRLWDSREVLKVLEQKKGTEKIEAISTEFSRGTAGSGGDIHTDEQLKNLTSLRILHASGARFSGDFENLFTELRWLRWRYCPLTFEAKNFHMNELAALDLSRSKISDQWQGWSAVMMAKKLKFLDLTHCPSLKGTFFLSALKNLEVLILRDCEEVEQIDSSIGGLKRLVSLDLTRCRSLKALPVEVAKLKALEQLLLEDNQMISEVPDIGDLENLEILNISGTGIKELPNGIGRLRKLRVLDASRCTELRGEMARSIRNLSFLQHLDFHGCDKLQELPELPEPPSSLAYLSVTCQSGRLPSLSDLIHLKELQLLDCRSLECISLFPSTLVELSKCSQPTDVEESKLPRTLHPPFQLETLKMHGCKFVKTLDVSQLHNLRTLDAENCINLLEIQGLDKLQYLESLTITGCTSIERLDLLDIWRLKILCAGNCEKLVDIQGLDRLKHLQVLNISGCILIEKLDLTRSEGIKILNAKHCKRLVQLQGLERLEFLEVLNISRCALFGELDLSKSKRLKKLEARACENLIGIQGLDRLKFLEELDISSWASIGRLDLPESNRLRILNAKHCQRLVKIQNLDKLEFLEELDISGCTSIERLDLSKSKNLMLLNAQKCEKLVEIQGLGELEFLEELNVSDCPSIERLDLSKSVHLKELGTRDCEKLVDRGIDRLVLLEGHTSLSALQ